MEMTEYYVSAGSQSVDCEASPPALQVEFTIRILIAILNCEIDFCCGFCVTERRI